MPSRNRPHPFDWDLLLTCAELALCYVQEAQQIARLHNHDAAEAKMKTLAAQISRHRDRIIYQRNAAQTTGSV